MLKHNGQLIFMHHLSETSTYPIARFDTSLLNCLHKTSFLVCHFAHPICFARGNEQMRRPPLHMSVQLVFAVDVEFGGVLHSACGTVVQAVFAVDDRVNFRKQFVVC